MHEQNIIVTSEIWNIRNTIELTENRNVGLMLRKIKNISDEKLTIQIFNKFCYVHVILFVDKYQWIRI